MNASPSLAASLTCHPETPAAAVHGIEVRVSRTEDRMLGFAYVLRGALPRLRIPEPRAPRAADHLWQHTCFEAFVSVVNQPGYCEIHFSPSGEWAVYAFERYRERKPLPERLPAPRMAFHAGEKKARLDAFVPLGRLPGIRPAARLRLALSAVIEDDRGMLSYWALRHPAGKPDFHHAAGFALELDLPEDFPQNSPDGDKR